MPEKFTLEDLVANIDDVLKSMGRYADQRKVLGLARIMHSVVNAFSHTHSAEANLVPGTERNFVRLKPSGLYSLYRGPKPLRVQPERFASFREGGTLFNLLHELFLELYGVKMMGPEAWTNDCYMFFNVPYIGPRALILGQVKAHEMLELPVPPVKVPSDLQDMGTV